MNYRNSQHHSSNRLGLPYREWKDLPPAASVHAPGVCKKGTGHGRRVIYQIAAVLLLYSMGVQPLQWVGFVPQIIGGRSRKIFSGGGGTTPTLNQTPVSCNSSSPVTIYTCTLTGSVAAGDLIIVTLNINADNIRFDNGGANPVSDGTNNFTRIPEVSNGSGNGTVGIYYFPNVGAYSAGTYTVTVHPSSTGYTGMTIFDVKNMVTSSALDLTDSNPLQNLGTGDTYSSNLSGTPPTTTVAHEFAVGVHYTLSGNVMTASGGWTGVNYIAGYVASQYQIFTTLGSSVASTGTVSGNSNVTSMMASFKGL